MGIIEGSIASFIFERDFSVWAIGWDSRLLACVYSVSALISLVIIKIETHCMVVVSN